MEKEIRRPFNCRCHEMRSVSRTRGVDGAVVSYPGADGGEVRGVFDEDGTSFEDLINFYYYRSMLIICKNLSW